MDLSYQGAQVITLCMLPCYLAEHQKFLKTWVTRTVGALISLRLQQLLSITEKLWLTLAFNGACLRFFFDIPALCRLVMILECELHAQ